MEKQKTGFKFGKHRLTILNIVGKVTCDGRRYELADVRTDAGLEYCTLRLFNEQGRFIKQLLFEPQIKRKLGRLLLTGKGDDTSGTAKKEIPK